MVLSRAAARISYRCVWRNNHTSVGGGNASTVFKGKNHCPWLRRQPQQTLTTSTATARRSISTTLPCSITTHYQQGTGSSFVTMDSWSSGTIQRTPVRSLSTTTDDDDDDEPLLPLPSLLARELAAEQDLGSTDMPEPLRELLEETVEPHWRLVDTPGQAVVKLYKKDTTSAGFSGRVVLSFHCQDTLPPDQLDLLKQGFQDVMTTTTPEGEDEETEEEASQPLRFDVTLSRAGKSLLVKCLSDQAQVTVEGLVVRDSHDSAITEGGDDHGDHYEGPDVNELPEDLQRALTALVTDDCGVTEDMAAFVAMYADYKEQTEYVRWMEGVKQLVE